MAYQYITKFDSPNYSPGRPAGAPNAIFIHYWDDPAKKPSFDGVVSWLCRKGGNSSAHYVVEAGKVACIVAPGNRAWHAGNLGNPRGIGIECNPRMSAGDLETVAELIANLRKTYGNLPLKPHNSVMQTSCPGPYAAKLGWLSQRANEILAGKPSASKPTTSTPAPTPATGGVLTVDGIWGPATTRALQRINKTPVDGVVSSQNDFWRAKNPGLGGGWQWVRNGQGSLLIRSLQRAFKVPQDGLIGPATIKGMQRYYGTPVDGVLSANSQAIMAMQRAINKQLGGK